MKKRYPLITTVIMLATLSLPAMAAEDKTPKSMPAAERPHWARTMLERLDRANRIILDPEYVVKQRERFEELATPFVIGTLKKNDHETVRILRDEVEKSERIAIEHLDLQFRQTMARRLTSQVELRLRYRWLKAWENTVRAWQKSSDPTDQLGQVLGWLQKSCKTIEVKNYEAITPVPSFRESTSENPLPPKAPQWTDTEDWSLTADDVAKAEKKAKEKEAAEEEPEREGEAPAEPKKIAPKPLLDINLAELSAKISGNNLALRRLEAKLVAGGTWDANRIDPFVTRLKKLAIHVEDTRLFYRLLAPSQQGQVKKIGDPTGAIKQLRSKIQAARIAVLEQQGTSSNLTKSQRAELQYLDRLSEELDSIEAPVGQGSP